MTMSKEEIAKLADELTKLAELKKARLQEVFVAQPKDSADIRTALFHLGFYARGQISWLIFDYNEKAPLLTLAREGETLRYLADKKGQRHLRRPIELFIRAQILGKKLSSITVTLDMKVPQIELFFVNGASIHFQIAPKFRNVFVRFEKKEVSEFKPVPVPDGLEFGTGVHLGHWNLAERPLRQEAGNAIEKKIKKLGNVREKIILELQNKRDFPGREIGEWLKAHQTLEIPVDVDSGLTLEKQKLWRENIDFDCSLAQNIERLFSKAKLFEAKSQGTLKRLSQVESEIQRLKENEATNAQAGSADSAQQEKSRRPPDLFLQAEASGRKYHLSDDLILYIGKNAKENLAILRKAQPFDLWIHIKDRPGAHGIIRKAKGRTLSDSELQIAGRHLLVSSFKSSLKRRIVELEGQIFDILCVECRFVRPIRGDRLGRVRYSNERVFRVRL